MTQLVPISSNLEDIELSDLTFAINWTIHDGQPYSHTLDLPLVVSMLSSYFQQPIPLGSVFVGEVDLASEIRSVHETSLSGLAEIFTPDSTSVYGKHVEKIYISEKNKNDLIDRDISKDSGSCACVTAID